MPKTMNASVEAESLLSKNIPFWLVTIELTGLTIRLTSHDSDVTFPLTDGETYTSWGFSFGDIGGQLGMEVDKVKIDIDNVSLAFSAWAAEYDFQGKKLTIARVFAGHLDDADKATVIFAGEMGAPQVDEETCSIEVKSPLIWLNQKLQRRAYSPDCPWRFDGDECRPGELASIAGETTGTAEAGSDASTLIDSSRTEDDEYWTPGTLEMTAGTEENIGVKRQVMTSSSGEIQVTKAFPAAIQTGDTYAIRRRCYKTAHDCWTRFDNLENFGGFEMIPRRK